MAMVTVHENVIWDALREAVEKIKAGVYLEKEKEVCKERLGGGAVNAIEIKDAYTLVHEGQQAIRIKLRFSGDLDLVLDFHGNCISTIQGAQIRELLERTGFGDVSVQAAPRTLLLPRPAEFLWQYVHSTPLANAVNQRMTGDALLWNATSAPGGGNSSSMAAWSSGWA